MVPIENTAIERKGKGFARNKKQVIRIDMTPMVDLGFLLITFFVFTTTITTPKATDLYMPRDEIVDLQKLPKSLALTLLLNDNNKIYYYHGDMDEAIKANEVFETSYSTYEGIGKVIRQKQEVIDASGKFIDGRRGMMMVIKPTSECVYKNLVDALDEVMINDVKKYAIVEPDEGEINFLARSRQ